MGMIDKVQKHHERQAKDINARYPDVDIKVLKMAMMRAKVK